MPNMNDVATSDNNKEDSPEIVIKTYKKMIADDIKRIEEEGGAEAYQMKACLYEKWVPDLLDTIYMLCKTTTDLEHVSTNAVIQLDHKLQESASATRAFMQRSAEMDSYYGQVPLFSAGGISEIATNGTDTEANLIISLQTELVATQKLLEESKIQCQVFQKTIQELQEKPMKRESQLDTLLENQPTILNGEIEAFEVQLKQKFIEIENIKAEKIKFEELANEKQHTINTLAVKAAVKHDVALQLESRLKQAEQRIEQYIMQLSDQSALLDTLRKHVEECKIIQTIPEKDKPLVPISKDEVTTSTQCQVPESSKPKEQFRLERRLEELEMMLRAKDEMISKLSSDNRTQPIASMIQQMSPDELRKALLNKEKQMEEQRILIGQLQDALVASKQKLEELQRTDASSDVSAAKGQSRDNLIKSLKRDLAELESQYSACFTEVCKQNQQMMLLRLACQQHAERADRLSRELQRNSSFPPPQQQVHETVDVSQLSEMEHELNMAKTQLNAYQIKNTELENELQQNKLTKSKTEENLEKLLSTENEKLIEEILNLQTCIHDGATLLYDKDAQINSLQEKLSEMCDEAEKQLNLMATRDIELAKLSTCLDNITEERNNLLYKISNLEDKNKTEYTETKQQLEICKEELSCLQQKYNIININLEAKEKKIEILKNKLIKNDKIQESMEQVEILKEQLTYTKTEVDTLRKACKNHEKTIESLQEQINSKQMQKIQDENELTEAKERIKILESEIFELKLQYDEKLQKIETIYNEKEYEMKKLLRMSCENVEELQKVNNELILKLEKSEENVSKLSIEIDEAKKIECSKLDELVNVRKEVELLSRENVTLQDQLKKSEKEIFESTDRLSQFERELVLSTERLTQYQAVVNTMQEEKQNLVLQLSEAREELGAQSLEHQQSLSEVNAHLHAANVEKEHLERSQLRLEELCKSLTTQLGGQRSERERVVRGLKQAAAERSRLCQEARQVLCIARQWLAEHRASALELRQLRAEKERLVKENTALRHRRHCTSLLNPWDCGLVDREESGFWSSHWTTQEPHEEDWMDQQQEDDENPGNCHHNDTGYQSGGSSK